VVKPENIDARQERLKRKGRQDAQRKKISKKPVIPRLDRGIHRLADRSHGSSAFAEDDSDLIFFSFAHLGVLCVAKIFL
jgi:hypothetical protein